MPAVAAEMVLGRLFDGSLSLHEFEIERGPYHRNCGCALHNLKGVCINGCSQKRNVSLPKKQTCAHHSLSIVASKISSQSSLVDKFSARVNQGSEKSRSGLQNDD